METTTIEVHDEPGIYHISGVLSTTATLCGYVDVLHDEIDSNEHQCNCGLCISTLKEIKKMRFKKGYFAT